MTSRFSAKMGRAALALLAAPAMLAQPQVQIVAGNYPDHATATSVYIGAPLSVAVDASGNCYFATDAPGIYRLDKAGQLTIVVAGLSADALALDKAGVILYAVTGGDDRVERIDLTTGNFTVYAGTGERGYNGDGIPATTAKLDDPQGLAVDAAGNLLIADTLNNRIRQVDLATGLISTIAGTGKGTYGGDGMAATGAQLDFPSGVAVDAMGNIYIADTFNSRVRRIAGGTISTYTTSVQDPDAVAVDPAGKVYVLGLSRFAGPTLLLRNIFRFDQNGAGVIAGTNADGYSGDEVPGPQASLNAPLAIATDTLGNLFIADAGNGRVRRVDANGNRLIHTVAGAGDHAPDGAIAANNLLSAVDGLALDSKGNIYFCEYGALRLRMIDAASGQLRTLAGTGEFKDVPDSTIAFGAPVSYCSAVALDAMGGLDFSTVAARNATSAYLVRRFPLPGGALSTLNINLNGPISDLSVDRNGALYIASAFGGAGSGVWRIAPGLAGAATRVAGNGGASGYAGDGGPATSATLSLPEGIAVDAGGNLYIADTNNHCVRRVDASVGNIHTVAGTCGTPGYGGDGGPATSAGLRAPLAVAVDGSGTGNLFIADTGNYAIRRVELSSGTIMTLAGNGTPFGPTDGPASNSAFTYPSRLALDSAGNLYVVNCPRNFQIGVQRGLAVQTPQSDAKSPTRDSAVTLTIVDGLARIKRLTLATAPRLIAGASDLSFSVQAGTTAPAPQPVNISSSGAAVSFTAASDSPWLTATPASGQTGGPIAISVNHAALAAGPYTGKITVRSTGAINSVTISVKLNVAPARKNSLALTPQMLAFPYNLGDPPPDAQVLSVGTALDGSLAFTAAASVDTDVAWLQIDTASGNTPATIQVGVSNLDMLDPGVYNGVITVTAPDADPTSQKIAVQLTVVDPNATSRRGPPR